MAKKTVSKNTSDIFEVACEMGDTLKDTFDKTDDLKTAQTAISSYKVALDAKKLEVINKRLTGFPKKITNIG